MVSHSIPWGVRVCTLASVAFGLLSVSLVVAAPPASRGDRTTGGSAIGPAVIGQVVGRHFQGKRDYRDGDLIDRDDVTQILAVLKERGWSPDRAKEIESAALPANDFLVKLLSSSQGRRFMRKVKSFKLIYDRLDRIARVSGGQRMLTDLVRLPDGHRYAAWRPKRGTPNLLDFLPKRGNGRRRSIKDYDKPTGKIYTAEQLQERLLDELSGKSRVRSRPRR